jgi:hypothetical protein
MNSGHTLIVIGWRGVRRAYLDIPKEEALARWRRHEGFSQHSNEPEPRLVSEIHFLDEFGVYDAWGDEGCENCRRYPTPGPNDNRAQCKHCKRWVKDEGQFIYPMNPAAR